MSTISQMNDTTTLNNGVRMPWLGLGVWKTQEGDEVINAVKYAVKAGYRSIDTAAVYGNEAGVGQAIRECGVSRDQLFITTKVWNADQGYDQTLRAFDESRRKLGLDVIDLYLVHWPVKGKYKETWKALGKLYKDGHVRAIGVSNFQVHHLKDIIEDSGVVPAVNQVEFHPLLNQAELRSFCKQQSIQMEAWSPLMQGNLDHPTLAKLAAKYGKTPAQIILRWDLQHGVVTIPKSVNEQRIIDNAKIFDFALSADDMALVDGMNQNKRFGADPDNFNF
ncbi:aldo/keto reductase [Paenibacillus allorhizosphaerae]|uniref:Oxidoreductase YtbE n=1 Tax=Paenibacillus allorhizosphaerae TaxID=2849866 RepID=A0ABM8VP23_9BACL|nr:aldo/keto reductase [Paenibacillus allorhizosphaerae]CAG7652353.1 putative oxidoreductase YtbE [Paenibacillus allorhizosphaerae]